MGGRRLKWRLILGESRVGPSHGHQPRPTTLKFAYCQTDFDLKGEGRVSGMESEKDDRCVIKIVLVAILLPLLLLLFLLSLLFLLLLSYNNYYFYYIFYYYFYYHLIIIIIIIIRVAVEHTGIKQHREVL